MGKAEEVKKGDTASLPPGLLDRLLNFATAAEEASESGTVSGARLSMRQLKRLGHRLEAFPATAATDLPQLVNDMLMVPFMPDQARHAVSSLMHSAGLLPSHGASVEATVGI